MVSYLILCRSLTYAQRTARVLERSGIHCQIMRTPRMISGEGCGHCVRISEHRLAKSLEILNREGIGAKRVYVEREDRTFDEVST